MLGGNRLVCRDGKQATVQVQKAEWSVQLEEGIRNLQHQNVWMIVLVADQDPFARPTHAMLIVVLFQSFQPRKY